MFIRAKAPRKLAKAATAFGLVAAAIAGTLVLAELSVRIFEIAGVEKQTSFCSWCRQASRASGRPTVGKGGLSPEMPPPIRVPAPEPDQQRSEIDSSLKHPKGFITGDTPYLSPRPGKFRSVVRTASGQTIYDVTYSIDGFRRRIVPRSSQSRERFLLLLGCSWTFGEGVEDDEALPSRVSELAPNHRVYNYGIPGGAPTDLLVRLRNSKISDELPEPRGSAAYMYFDDHLARVLGPMSLVSTWGGWKPYFEEAPGGKLEWKGSFESGRPRTTGLYRLLWKSRLLQRFDIDLPPWMTDSQLRFFARLVAELR
ncbi:MAG TPA: hypothetical protein VM598_04165, partial [Bdellovibrionota bacterium]|nr:hypothetical protein [Bdellovibrionota bacterium]